MKQKTNNNVPLHVSNVRLTGIKATYNAPSVGETLTLKAKGAIESVSLEKSSRKVPEPRS